jgi:alkylation response protein AidB-like acyl-CoA dehydrogenase
MDESVAGLRQQVRRFLHDELEHGRFVPRCDSWLSGFDPAFSRRVGDHGWIGMTWPRDYGGGAQSSIARWVVTEELLAAGAPVAAHWVGDRQAGPALLRDGTEEQRRCFVPLLARAERLWAIGMSEPDAGSDLASVRTRAQRRDDGAWYVTGSKVWTSHAHRADYFTVLCRTSDPNGDRHRGLSQMIVDLRAPGVSVRPIRLLNGEHHFNEVVLDDVRVADNMVLGTVGEGWRQVTAELAFERSGPERFLSTFPLLQALLRASDGTPHATARQAIGSLFARLIALRRMSLGVAATMEAGVIPETHAALVKDVGTQFEIAVIEAARAALRCRPDPRGDGLERLLADAVLAAPGFTLRGGTTEILRGIVARQLVASA